LTPGWDGGLGRRERVGNGRGEKGEEGGLRGRGKWIGRGGERRNREASFEIPNATDRGAGNCGDQSSPLTMHYVGEKLGENRGRNGRILTPNERVLTLGVTVYGVKFHQN